VKEAVEAAVAWSRLRGEPQGDFNGLLPPRLSLGRV
jgi:hypothetical protein